MAGLVLTLLAVAVFGIGFPVFVGHHVRRKYDKPTLWTWRSLPSALGGMLLVGGFFYMFMGGPGTAPASLQGQTAAIESAQPASDIATTPGVAEEVAVSEAAPPTTSPQSDDKLWMAGDKVALAESDPAGSAVNAAEEAAAPPAPPPSEEQQPTPEDRQKAEEENRRRRQEAIRAIESLATRAINK